MTDKGSEITSKLTTHDTYSSGIEVAVFELSVEGSRLKVEFFEDGDGNFDKQSVRVRDIRVPEQERGKGLGQILQSELLQECKKRGVQHIFGSSQNPYALLSWLKIPEARRGFHLMNAGKRVNLDTDFIEILLRKEIDTREIQNKDIQPINSKFFDYVVDLE